MWSSPGVGRIWVLVAICVSSFASCRAEFPADVTVTQQLVLTPPVTLLTGDSAAVSAQFVSASGTSLPVATITYRIADTSIASVSAGGTLRARRPGITDLIGTAGGSTATVTIHIVPRLRSLTVQVAPRTLAVGDSTTVALRGRDSAGVAQPSFARVTMTPAEGADIRGALLIGRTPGVTIIEAQAGTLRAVDTIVVQGPSSFDLAISAVRGTSPAPRLMASLARVQAQLRRVVRVAPPGARVRLAADACGNSAPLDEAVSGLTVFVRFGQLTGPALGLSGPCVLRENSGLPLLGLVEIDTLKLGAAPDSIVDRLMLHEVLHVMGVGVLWAQPAYGGHVVGGPEDADPIYTGPAALRGWRRIAGSTVAAVRPIPLQVGSRDHWRLEVLFDEIMSPRLRLTPQVFSAITVGALRDIGWTVEPEAYDDLVLGAPPTARTSLAACIVCERPFVETLRPPQFELQRDGTLRPLVSVTRASTQRPPPSVRVH
jgi:hypothetical protein